MCTIDYVTLLSPVGSYGYLGCYFLIFPDTSSITCFPDKSSTILGPGRVESLHCIPILLYARVSQPRLFGHLGLGSSLLWEAVLFIDES